jgi:hypothetical protein
MPPRPIILDTDIDTDCDDAGALALLHALMDTGACRLLGVVCDVPVPACPGAVRAINHWYGRGALPVGLVQVPDYQTSPTWQPYRDHRAHCLRGAAGAALYNDLLARTRPPQDPPPEPAVSCYRRLLAAAPDDSITICAIGTLTALAQLLVSGPDGCSPLPGRDLVARKVRELVTMAKAPFPAGRECFNWRMDSPSAAAVLHDWPTALAVSWAGDTVPTGARFVAAAPPGQPVREAYVRFLGGSARNRPSWDLLAALYAVRGLADLFSCSPPRSLKLDLKMADYVWASAAEARAPRFELTPRVADAVLAEMVEDLMLASLAGRGRDAELTRV